MFCVFYCYNVAWWKSLHPAAGRIANNETAERELFVEEREFKVAARDAENAIECHAIFQHAQEQIIDLVWIETEGSEVMDKKWKVIEAEHFGVKK